MLQGPTQVMAASASSLLYLPQDVLSKMCHLHFQMEPVPLLGHTRHFTTECSWAAVTSPVQSVDHSLTPPYFVHWLTLQFHLAQFHPWKNQPATYVPQPANFNSDSSAKDFKRTTFTFRNQFCYNFSSWGCARQRCHFMHICNYCGGAHAYTIWPVKR